MQFKDVTQGIFKDISRNELVIRIQPSEAVYLKLNAKTPGLYTRAVPVDMDLTYKRRFGEVHIPEAYEALILDALKGDHSNFVRDDELDVAWKVQHLFFRLAYRVCKINGMADLHPDPALDRGAQWTSTKASTVPLWRSWAKRNRSVRPEVRVPAIDRGIVSVFTPSRWAPN